MKAKFKILFFLLIIGSQALFGQTRKISGTVTGDEGETMPGVTVVLVGTSQGILTDLQGKYTLNAAPGDQLKFSFVGYQDQTIIVGNGLVINVQMATALTQLEDVVVVGYATQAKKSVVGAIAQTSGETLKSKGAVSNITDALSGTIPGVTIMIKTGLPGGSSSEHGNPTEILIRGLTTWNNSQPLILVDGVQRPMSDVSVEEIESFTVLKDASATAVFGVKGANGVILITTKRGQTGKAKVTAEANFSMKSISEIEKPLESYDALMARNWTLIHEMPLSGGVQMAKYTPERVLNYYLENARPDLYTDEEWATRYTNVDWLDYMTKENVLTSKYSVNVQGGTEFVKYFTTLSYLNEGDVMNTGNGDNPRGYTNEFKYQRVNFRTNLDFSLSKSTTFKVNLSGYYGRRQEPNQQQNAFWPGLYRYSPTTPLPIYPDGTLGADDKDKLNLMGNNHYLDLITGGSRIEKRTALTSDFDLEQKLDFFTKGLSVRGRISFDNYFTSRGSNVTDPSAYVTKRFETLTDTWYYDIPAGTNNFDFNPVPIGYTTETPDASSTWRNLYYELALNYRRTFGKHFVDVLALFSREQNAGGSNWPSKREDWVGRVKYEYAEKYLFEVNGAYNGSEKFRPGNNFDLFPSFSVGWRVSEEPFIKNNIPQISNLKLRYSIGWVGSDNTGDNSLQWGYATFWNPYTYLNNSDFPNQVQADVPVAFGNLVGGVLSPYVNQSFVEGAAGNPDLGWETKRSQNIGIDLSLFKNLITGSVDYFMDYRYDMIIPSGRRNAVPEFYGNSFPSVNYGEVESSGLELEIKTNKRFGKVDLWASYMWTVAKNKVIYQEDPPFLPPHQRNEGFAIGQRKPQIVAELIDSWDDLYTGVMSEAAANRKNTLTGSFRTVDYNADGILNSNDNAAEGYARQPQNTYGFSFGGGYKGLSLMVQFYGMYNTTILGGAYNEEMMYGFPLAFQSRIDRIATPEYGVSDPTYRALGFEYRGSIGGYGNYDASFLRLKTLELSYTLPKNMLKRISMDNVRIFVNGSDLWLWNKIPVDVEATDLDGENNLKFPLTKSINFGIVITL